MVVENPSFRQHAPRPLGLYMALLTLQQNPAQLMQFMAPAGQAGLDFLRQIGLPDLSAQAQQFLHGVQCYRGCPAAPVRQYRTQHQWGNVQLQYITGTGPTVLLVPSMINKGYIFDLLPDHSFARTVVAAGYSVYLLDWGTPDPTMTLDDAVGHVLQALTVLGPGVHLVGYCMGGLLSVAAAQLANQASSAAVGSLALLATPWDFAATTLHGWCVVNQSWAVPALQALPLVPVDVLQTLFALLQPFTAVERLTALVNATPDQQMRLAAIEDWLADGVPLGQQIALGCLQQWYIQNAPLRGQWQVRGETVSPGQLNLPTWVLCPDRDVIVPKPSALALAQQLPAAQCTVREVTAGHIGIMVGRRAPTEVFAPYVAWLGALSR